MKKTMESAYTDMMNNLAKSTAAIPLHLQGASGALAWWEQPDSLMAKSEIAPAEELAKASAENETDEAYEEDEKKDKEKKESKKEDDADETDEEHDEDPEPAEEGMKKSMASNIAMAAASAPVYDVSKALAELNEIADGMLKKGIEVDRAIAIGAAAVGALGAGKMVYDEVKRTIATNKRKKELAAKYPNVLPSHRERAAHAEATGTPTKVLMFKTPNDKPSGTPGTPMAKSAAAEAEAHVEKVWQLYRDNH